jgi:hypothetical protein
MRWDGSDLSPRLKVEPRPPVSGCTNEPTVYVVAVRSNSQSIQQRHAGKTQTVSSFGLSFNDQELAERVAKALTHLVRESGAEDEPF